MLNKTDRFSDEKQCSVIDGKLCEVCHEYKAEMSNTIDMCICNDCINIEPQETIQQLVNAIKRNERIIRYSKLDIAQIIAKLSVIKHTDNPDGWFYVLKNIEGQLTGIMNGL